MKAISQPTKALVVRIAAVMALAALVFDALTWFKMRSSIEAVGRSMETITELERLASLLKDGETGQRGFLLTGDESYLEPLNLATNRLPDTFERLAALDQPQTSYMGEIKEIRGLVRNRLDLARETVVVRRREGLDAAIAMVKTNRGKDWMDQIRGKIAALLDQQQDIINRRNKVMEKDLRWGYVSAISTGVIALLAGGLAWFLLRESLRQMRRESRLAAEKLRAEESNRQKSSFLATMSHEIRTPMNAILGFTELLETEVVTEKQKRYVRAILTGGRSLLQLINDILDLSKIEAGMMSVDVEPMDVREIGQFLQQLFSEQATKKNVALRIEVPDSLPHSLLMDSIRLRQILINLVGNALKFTENGQVLVRFYPEALPDKHSRINLLIDVEDSGEGIPADQQRSIFQPFVQGAKQQRGTGLGLTIVQRLVEMMGGTVTLRSDVGVGSTFHLAFPQVEISARLPKSHIMDQQAVDFDDLRPSALLVVDDNQTNRELVQGMFENTRHRVHLAADGAAAVQAVTEERPDLVLMDIRMPGMNGREALEAIRARPDCRLLPVIAVTASSLSSEERDLRRSFDGYVRKPFSRAELYQEMAQFIPKYESVADSRPAAVMEDNALTPELAAKWEALAAKFRELERDVWPGVRDGMVMSEVKNFAEGLRKAAFAALCPPMETYASQMSRDADAFALAALEQQLAEFPMQIEALERGISHATL